MTYAIRLMQSDDIAAVVQIEEQVAIDPWTEKLFVDCLRVGYSCWVVTAETTVVGFAIMSYAAEEAHVLNLAVSRDYQGKGLGQELLQHLIFEAKEHDNKVLHLEVRASNAVAQNLYRKFNFEEIGIRKQYYRTATGKEDAVLLALVLIDKGVS